MSSAQLSAKMMEAQVYFQKVVKHELQLLVASGQDRDVAVKMLLHRIVQTTYAPEEADVKRVMKQFQMMHDDAVRALIVKQEIGRLKGQGLDAFAAIELLTRKMQRINEPEKSEGDISEIARQDEETASSGSTHEDMNDLPTLEPVEGAENGDEEVVNTEMHETQSDEHSDADQNSSQSASPAPAAADQATEETSETTDEAPVVNSPEASSVASLSLCERIDQVSISAASPEAATATEVSSTPATRSISTAHSTSRSAFTLFSAHSRKRRITSGASRPLNDNDDTLSSPRENEEPSTTQRSHFFMSRPMSPTFRFPKNKKQKLWTDEENNEPLFDSISFKEGSIPPPASPTGVGTTNETPNSSNTATPTKVGKRRRPISGMSSPELDELDMEDSMVRVSKRHRL